MMTWYPMGQKASPALHRQCLLLLQATANFSNLNQLRLAMPGMFEGTEYYTYIAGTNNAPAITIVDDGAKVLVAVNGSTNLAQIIATIQSWHRSGDFTNPGHFSPLYDGVAAQIASAIRFRWHAVVPPTRIVGHSFGGAVAHAYWLNYGAAGGQNQTECITYGAPRSSWSYWRVMSESPSVVRVFGIDDVVPNLPAHTSESPSFSLLLPNDIVLGANRMKQPCNGLAVDRAGNTLPSYGVPIPISPFNGPLANWLIGTQAIGSNPHSIISYMGRFQLVPLDNLPVPPTVPGPQLPGPGNIPARQQRANEQAAVAAIANLNAANPAAAIVSTTANVVPVRTQRFTRATIQGVRYIRYGEDLITVARDKREQRRLVRAYNRYFAGMWP